MICSSELNKSQWPRLGAAHPGISSSEEQQVWGNERLFFLTVAIVYCQNKSKQNPASTQWIKALSTDNKRSALLFWSLSSIAFHGCAGESFVLRWCPQGCAQRPSAEPGFWCRFSLLDFCYLTVLLSFRMMGWCIKVNVTPAPSKKFGHSVLTSW